MFKYISIVKFQPRYINHLRKKAQFSTVEDLFLKRSFFLCGRTYLLPSELETPISHFLIYDPASGRADIMFVKMENGKIEKVHGQEHPFSTAESEVWHCDRFSILSSCELNLVLIPVRWTSLNWRTPYINWLAHARIVQLVSLCAKWVQIICNISFNQIHCFALHVW